MLIGFDLENVNARWGQQGDGSDSRFGWWSHLDEYASAFRCRSTYQPSDSRSLNRSNPIYREGRRTNFQVTGNGSLIGGSSTIQAKMEDFLTTFDVAGVDESNVFIAIDRCLVLREH